MIPKPKRIKDKKAIEQARKPYSELPPNKPTYGAPPHHYYFTVAAGGPDHKFNLIQLTGSEHVAAHAGNISKETLLEIVARREGLDKEVIRDSLIEMRTYGRGRK